MPHFITRKPQNFDLPFTESGFSFEFSASNARGERIILVKTPSIDAQAKGKEFFISEHIKEGYVIYKGLKQTRPSPVGILKNVLSILKNNIKDNEVISHNLSYNKPRQEASSKNSKYLLSLQDCIALNKHNDISIEIGFGSGRHLLHLAKKYPKLIFLGLEIHNPSLEQVLRQIEILDLQNLFLSHTDARLILEFIRTNSLANIYLHFPIPWGKAVHRRVISKKFLTDAYRALRVDSYLHIRSDDKDYIHYTLDLLALLGFDYESKKNKDLDTSSKYEMRWKKQQKDIIDIFVFKHINDTQTPSKNTLDSKDFTDAVDTGGEVACLDELKGDLFSKCELLYTQNKQRKIIHKDYFFSLKDIYKGIFKQEDVFVVSFSIGDFNVSENVFLIVERSRAYFLNQETTILRNFWRVYRDFALLLEMERI